MSELKGHQLALMLRRVNERLMRSPYHRLTMQTEEFAVLFMAFIEEFHRLQAETAAQDTDPGRRS